MRRRLGSSLKMVLASRGWWRSLTIMSDIDRIARSQNCECAGIVAQVSCLCGDVRGLGSYPKPLAHRFVV